MDRIKKPNILKDNMEEEKINFKEIEKKYQKKWEKEKAFEAQDNSKKPKFYILEMFPYPSGDGLHMGHALNYTIGDILARYKIMSGFNVLHPMGYDALGLPAENAAIKAGTHPQDYTDKSIKNFMRQQKELGITYDWSRVVNTASPEYYKWDQWIFLKMLEKGLAYQKTAAVNWCPKCETVLANEQVQNGKCWRHEDTDVEIKQLKQWFFKTTHYANELYDNIDKLDWPERTKAMQKNWIGKSHGTEIDFEIENPGESISNIVVVHGGNVEKDKEYNKHWMPWLKKELDKRNINSVFPQMPVDSKATYEKWKKIFEKIKVDKNSILVGHSRGAAFLVRWLGDSKIKIKKLILVAPCKFASVNYKKTFYDFEINPAVRDLSGEIIIFSSDNDEDSILKSVKEYHKILSGEVIEMKNHGHFLINEFPELLEKILLNKKWPIFTTRPDTIFGVTFMVVSAQHPRLMELVTKEQKKDVEKFLKKVKTTSQKSMKDVDELNKDGVFTGSYAINPATNEKVPVWAGNFVVADYGSGMVMAVPAHDQRDFEFAKKYNIKIKQVIAGDIKERAYTERGILINSKVSKPIRSYLMGAEKISDDDLIDLGIKIIEKKKDGDRKIEIPEENLSKYEKLIESKLTKGFWNEYIADNIVFMFKHKNNTFEKIILSKETKERIDKLAAKFIGEEWKKSNPLTWLAENSFYTDIITNKSTNFNSLDNEKAKEEITKYLNKQNKARKVINFKLRDWLISRQRYWGTPIPIIHCDKCGAIPVPEKELPIILPEDVKFGKGNPLLTNEKWISTKCPKCNGKAKRETDTMDTFVNSSWYFLRYCDPKNNKKIFDTKKANYWCPIDQYIGGAEHTCMHLIYFRYYTKFLADLGLINFREPAKKLFHQGMLSGEGGLKMSKSKGNVINPDHVSEKYGIDTARYFLLSLASPDKPRDWSESGIQGSLRFINKIFRIYGNPKIGKDSEETEILINKTIKETAKQYETFDYRTATIRLKELFEHLEKQKEISRETLERSLKILNPICPHITEHLWEKLGNKTLISLEKWPESKEIKTKQQKTNINQTIINYAQDIIKKVEEKQKVSKVYIYVMPFELNQINEKEIQKSLNKQVTIFAVNDPNKIDPQNISKKAVPGRPGVYLE